MAVTAQQRRIIEQAATAGGIDPSILYGVWGRETGFGTSGTSPAGAQGPFQIMPDTAKSLGLKDPNDFRAAAFAAAKYLGQYKSRGVEGMLAAYNAGPNGNPNNAETKAYIPAVLNFAKQWGGGGAVKAASGSSAALGVPAATNASSAPAPDVAGLLALLQGQQRSAPASSTLATPSFAAGPKLASGALPPSSGAPQPKQDVSKLLAAVASLNGQSQAAGGSINPNSPDVKVTPASKIAKGAQAGIPVLKETSEGALHQTSGLAGYPAHDFFAPAGSPAVAPVTGKVVRFSGHDPAAGPTDGPHGPFGYSVYIQGDDGKSYYLTHMGSRSIKVGQTVKAGQVIGTVGNYAKWGGANHIHMGVHSG